MVHLIFLYFKTVKEHRHGFSISVSTRPQNNSIYQLAGSREAATRGIKSEHALPICSNTSADRRRAAQSSSVVKRDQ